MYMLLLKQIILCTFQIRSMTVKNIWQKQSRAMKKRIKREKIISKTICLMIGEYF